MKHTIQPFHPDPIYEIIVNACFSIKAKSEEEAKQKLEALLNEIDADHWQVERVSKAGN
ncbi:hypothetical protein PCC8801_2851 [Rippkaea orientalis PCC 8801]|uniref:Uncharacterized protein n=1 Tax=Rippkaea orientalis (strain PCC 8801 / RF-1) TaxID=41431 RepID=B7JUZ8_RIPO1|nr:hypothetical protein [Rippkaea orientalis]ACK66850.1 hypothetical protein PCC8801_2851 [Rippkaea orientalis PCC 8801]